jgi:hypothetical protein
MRLFAAVCMQTLRDYKADAWMSVGLSIGPVVKDNTGCIMAHALGIHQVDVSGNAFFDGPPSVPQVRVLGKSRSLKHCNSDHRHWQCAMYAWWTALHSVAAAVCQGGCLDSCHADISAHVLAVLCG